MGRRVGAARCPRLRPGPPGVLAARPATLVTCAPAATWPVVSPGTGNDPISDTPVSSHTHRLSRFRACRTGPAECQQQAAVRTAGAGPPVLARAHPDANGERPTGRVLHASTVLEQRLGETETCRLASRGNRTYAPEPPQVLVKMPRHFTLFHHITLCNPEDYCKICSVPGMADGGPSAPSILCRPAGDAPHTNPGVLGPGSPSQDTGALPTRRPDPGTPWLV